MRRIATAPDQLHNVSMNWPRRGTSRSVRIALRSVHEADDTDFEESRRTFRGDARVSVDSGDDQRRWERYVERLIRLQPQRHGDAEGAAAAGDWSKTCACVGAQLWLEDADGRDDVVEIGDDQVCDAERTLVRTSPEMNVVDGDGRLAEKGLLGSAISTMADLIFADSFGAKTALLTNTPTRQPTAQSPVFFKCILVPLSR